MLSLLIHHIVRTLIVRIKRPAPAPVSLLSWLVPVSPVRAWCISHVMSWIRIISCPVVVPTFAVRASSAPVVQTGMAGAVTAAHRRPPYHIAQTIIASIPMHTPKPNDAIISSCPPSPVSSASSLSALPSCLPPHQQKAGPNHAPCNNAALSRVSLSPARCPESFR